MKTTRRNSLAGPYATQNSRRKEYMAAFVANRIQTIGGDNYFKKRKAKGMSKKRKEAAGKTLNIRKSEPHVQRGLMNSGSEEWDTWMESNAAKIIPYAEARELMDQGPQGIADPMDRN